LDENLEGFRELVLPVAEQVREEYHVARGGNGQEFGQAFYDGGQNGV
jgi:hypothetical protein